MALSLEVQPNEQFSRFIFSRKHYAAEKGRVKPQALLPSWNDEKQRWETSIQRIDGLDTLSIWNLGYKFVENESADRIIKARGSGNIDLIKSQELQLEIAGEPYPRHVNIINWPEHDAKDVRLMKATEIANQLTLELDPRQSPK
ncbi:MAG: hypothetical protein U1F68_16590 [Gammaproteobacteria bacterium]